VKEFVVEPHEAILGYKKRMVLDMTSIRSDESRKVAVDLVKDHPRHLKNDWAMAINRATNPSQSFLDEFDENERKNRNENEKFLKMPARINWDLMRKLYDFQPKNYEELLAMKGVGPSTVRALALISELIYGNPPSWNDPVKYSFAVGGKDGVPYPVDRSTMDESIAILKNGIDQAKVGKKDKIKAFRRLKEFIP
jgi:hypothetical protein